MNQRNAGNKSGNQDPVVLQRRALGKTMSVPSSPHVKKVYRLVILGSIQCGKTSIINRFLKDEFTTAYMPTIEDFHRRVYRIRGELYQLDIVDSSGHDPFPAARKLSLATGDLFMLVCSVDRPCSMEQVLHHVQLINECKHYPPPLVIAVNKIDLPPDQHKLQVQGDAGVVHLIKQSKPPSIHMCSAKTAMGVKSLFADLLSQANLPNEMNLAVEGSDPRPNIITQKNINHQELLQADNRQSVRHTTLSRLRSRKSNPLAVFDDAEARRPSLRTDLLLMNAKRRGELKNGQSPKLGKFNRLNWFNASADDAHAMRLDQSTNNEHNEHNQQKCVLM